MGCRMGLAAGVVGPGWCVVSGVSEVWRLPQVVVMVVEVVAALGFAE